MSTYNITIIDIKKKISLNYPKYNNDCIYGIFPWELKNQFKSALVNEALSVQATEVLLYSAKDNGRMLPYLFYYIRSSFSPSEIKPKYRNLSS